MKLLKKLKSCTSVAVCGLIAITLGIFAGGAQSASAQSSNLPIYSVGAAVDNNLLLIAKVSGSLYAPSLISSNGLNNSFSFSYNPNGLPKESEIAALIAAQPLTFKLANPSNDWVSENVSYVSTDGDQLFQGGNSFKEVLSGGVWTVPSGVKVAAQLGQYSPIYEKGATWTQIVLRDADGNILGYVPVTVKYNSQTGYGKILYDNYYLGQHGELSVWYGQFDQYGNATNSYQVDFKMDDEKGARVDAPTQSTTINSSFDSLVQLSPPNIYLFNVASYDHHGSSPLVEFTVVTAGWINFHADTIEGELFYGVNIKLLQEGAVNKFIEYDLPANGPKYLPVYLQPGLYHADFLWPQLSPWQAYPPGQGGGIGMGVEPVATTPVGATPVTSVAGQAVPDKAVQ